MTTTTEKTTGHLEYSPGCLWCESTEDALDLLAQRETGPNRAETLEGRKRIRCAVLYVTAACGDPTIRRQR